MNRFPHNIATQAQPKRHYTHEGEVDVEVKVRSEAEKTADSGVTVMRRHLRPAIELNDGLNDKLRD